MKCPKCHYVSFDPEPRCRNCGYTLDLDPDLVIDRPRQRSDAPLVDLELRSEPPNTSPAPDRSAEGADARQPIEDEHIPEARRRPERAPRTPTPAPPTPTPAPARPKREPPPATSELPLFVKPAPADRGEPAPADRGEPAPASRPEPPLAARARTIPVEPAEPAPPDLPDSQVPADRAPSPPTLSLPKVSPPVASPPIVRRPASPAPPTGAPRYDPPGPEGEGEGEEEDPLLELPLAPAPPPLGVRRKTADLLRPPVSRPAPVDVDLLRDLDAPGPFPEERPVRADVPRTDAFASELAGTGRRLGAALIDAAALGGIALLVLWVTLRWMEFSWEEWTSLPLLPLAAFLLMIAAGYLFVFTLASGQTPGKMMTRIRVVDADVSDGPVGLSQALLRALAALPAVLLAGLGFVPALMGDQRAVHDRIAHTRVVRA